MTRGEGVIDSGSDKSIASESTKTSTRSTLSSSISSFLSMSNNSILADPTTNPSKPQINSSSFTSTISSFLQRMHPSTCISGLVDDPLDSPTALEDILPQILSDLSSPTEKKRKRGVQRLFQLTTRPCLRVSLVTNHNGVELCRTILGDSGFGAGNDNSPPCDPRMACLMLINLSIPHENKDIMVADAELLAQLTQMLQRPTETTTTTTRNQQDSSLHQYSEISHFICLIFMNLSYCPPSHHQRLCVFSLDGVTLGDQSLLRRLEQTAVSYYPWWKQSVQKSKTAKTTTKSVESEFLRYTAGFLRNVTRQSPQRCQLVSRTRLPLILLQILQQSLAQLMSSSSSSSYSLHRWTCDSLEDLSLLTLVQLATYPESCAVLRTLDATQYLSPLLREEQEHDSSNSNRRSGIHETRAACIHAAIRRLERRQRQLQEEQTDSVGWSR